MTEQAKFIKPGGRLMDRAWMRDGEHIYTGEALTLACLLHVRKGRDKRREEELKDLLGVLPQDKPRKKGRGARKPPKE